VKPSRPAFFRGNERDILRLTVSAIVRATRDGDVEFSRQVSELRVALAADDDAVQFVDDGEASNNSFGVKPARAQPLMLRTLSMPVCSVRRSTPRSFSQISGTVSRVNRAAPFAAWW